MAVYKITDYVVNKPTIDEVQAALEAKYDALDSTNNVIKLVKILPESNESFTGVMLYTIP